MTNKKTLRNWTMETHERFANPEAMAAHIKSKGSEWSRYAEAWKCLDTAENPRGKFGLTEEITATTAVYLRGVIDGLKASLRPKALRAAKRLDRGQTLSSAKTREMPFDITKDTIRRASRSWRY